MNMFIFLCNHSMSPYDLRSPETLSFIIWYWTVTIPSTKSPTYNNRFAYIQYVLPFHRCLNTPILPRKLRTKRLLRWLRSRSWKWMAEWPSLRVRWANKLPISCGIVWLVWWLGSVWGRLWVEWVWRLRREALSCLLNWLKFKQQLDVRVRPWLIK